MSEQLRALFVLITYVAVQNCAFGQADPICAYLRLSRVNFRNYICVCLYDCEKRGNASQITKKLRRRIAEIFCEGVNLCIKK